MSFTHPSRTTLAGLFGEALPRTAARRGARLGGEALLLTLVSAYLPIVMGFGEAGLISVFLVSASLADRLSLLLEENRDNIYVVKTGPWVANRRTAWSVLAIFLGILLGYAVVGVTVGEWGSARFFGFAIESAGLREETLLERDFGNPVGLFADNAIVLGTVFLLALVYRSYGAMLAIAWNGCVWAIVLTLLAETARSAASFPGPAFFAISAAAVLPHLTLEAFAYVLGSLAAIFTSKAITTYAFSDPILREVVRVSAVLVAVSAGVLALAAGVEAGFTPWLLGFAN
jgi:hypothetical protein